MSYKDGLEIILPTFLRIRKAIDYGYNSIVLIAKNRDIAKLYFRHINIFLKRVGYMEKVERVSICNEVGSLSNAYKNKDNTLIILCGQWYRNEMFRYQGVLEAMCSIMSESLPEKPSKVFNRSTGEVEYITDWFGDKTNG
ncbi:hypothetical protein I9Y31_000486 [Clostridium perfringens]|nr:hypothetical protein [Clostridium perfringens]